MKYGIKSQTQKAIAVINCESGFRINVWSWNHSSYGVSQFTKSTWQYSNKIRGTELNYENPYDQIDMMAWLWVKGYQGWWDCYKILYSPTPH